MLRFWVNVLGFVGMLVFGVAQSIDHGAARFVVSLLGATVVLNVINRLVDMAQQTEEEDES